MPVLALVVVAVVLVRGGDDTAQEPVDVTAQRNYCSRVTELDAVSAGAGIGLPPAPGPEPTADAVRQVMDEFGTGVEEMQKLAPDEIEGAVNTVAQSLHAARNGDLTAIKSPGFSAARQRMADFGADFCVPPDSDSGNG